MKKKYIKPEYLAEKFGFAQTIAEVCSGDWGDSYPTHLSKNSCAWAHDGGEEFIFLATVDACTTPLDENASFEGICYNTPANGTTVFASY